MKHLLKYLAVGTALWVCTAADAASPSGSLPIIYVNTAGNAQITSKEDYIDATYYLDPCGSDFDAVGSEASPLPTEIRGRGNYTWLGFDKKPYKLKLSKKAALLGMNKSKHYALLAHADDDTGFLRNTVGFEMSRRMGLAWTPAQQPVELVLNGEYQGLYMLTETIRVDEDRVNIVEQPDGATDPEEIKGGWLVEIDNYDDDPHATIPEGCGDYDIWFTYDTPEEVSAEQEKFLTDAMTTLDHLIYASDKTDSSALEAMLDIDALARYYIVQEVVDNCESFHGSCYLYRDQPDGSKWTFGPVWDFGNAFQRDKGDNTIYQGGLFHQVWIEELCKFPAIQQKIKDVWAEFATSGYQGLSDFIDTFSDGIATAMDSDHKLWPQYGASDRLRAKETVQNRLASNISTLSRRFGTEVVQPVDIYLRGDFNGWDTSYKMKEQDDGTYLVHVDHLTSGFKVASDDWDTIDFGAPADAAPLTINQPYPLIRRGGNIAISSDVDDVNVVYNPADCTLEVKDYMGIADVADQDSSAPLALTGRTLRANTALTVYSLAGTVVATLAPAQTTTLAPGFYIAAGQKIAVK